MSEPKYVQIERELRHEIERGDFEYGDRFYSEAELARRFDVSSITVIHAIKDLVSEGYLVRHQGKGTFISRSRKNQLVEFNDIEVFSDRSDEERVEVIEMSEGHSPVMCQELGLSDGGTYYKLVRVRYVGDEPYHLQYSFIPARYVRTDVDPSYYSSVYARFREDHDIHLYNEPSTERDEILYPAPPEIAERLCMGERAPVVLQEKVTRRLNGEPLEYVRSYKRWDYYKIAFSTCPAGR